MLTKQVNSIISKSQDALSQFKAYVDNRSRAKNEQLTGINAALDSGIKKFKKEQEKYDMFGEIEIKTLLEKFETGLKENPESEKKMLENFSIEANKKIKEVLTRKPEIATTFDEWKVENKLSRRISLKFVLPEDVPQIKYEDLKNDEHWKVLDPHFYFTNKYTLTALMIATSGTMLGASVKGM